ncbi:MAG: hypothetical protein LBE83_09805 [Propionibacteriaceae bacterium]|jgi:hypothetical protein|nr:hypothetical protein [Propionibacteriaceae bacterium]
MTKDEVFLVDLSGLLAAPAQTWGAVRLVPLLREAPVGGLRLHPRLYGPNSLSIVGVGPRKAYISYIPHGLVATWSRDGEPSVTAGTQLLAANQAPTELFQIAFRKRMARQLAPNQVRFLPLHLAMEGFLSLGFSGPPTRWPEWSRRAFQDGLSPRIEHSWSGKELGLDDALRVFEIHPGQCGVVVYFGDVLAAAFVVPHADHYRLLHPSLVENFFGSELIHHAAHANVGDLVAHLDDDADPATDLADLGRRLEVATEQWRDLHTLMAGGLLDVPFHSETVYRMGRFTLNRFHPDFDLTGENHIGEAITDETGQLAYLSTYRLSLPQTKRCYLLSVLAENDWHLDNTAAALNTDRNSLVRRLDNAGFGYLLKPDILAIARRPLD